MTDLTNLEDLEPEAIELVATPGFRFYAPAGTDAPIASVKAGRFVDTWPMSWLPLQETIPGTPMLRLTSYQRATGDDSLSVHGRSQTWGDIYIPPGSVALMLGWESGRSDVRIVGQGVIEQSWLDSLTRAMYAR
jgi:hypothetical protein